MKNQDATPPKPKYGWVVYEVSPEPGIPDTAVYEAFNEDAARRYMRRVLAKRGPYEYRIGKFRRESL